MASSPSLGRLQRWMQAVITHPGSVEEGLESRAALAQVKRTSIARVVLPSRTLSGVERLAIYHAMYLLRLTDALRTDYPAIDHYLGDEGFRAFTERYVTRHPSRSYTLNRLGDHVPGFIRADRKLRERGFLHDLARLELAMSEAFDATCSTPLDAAAIASVPDGLWPRAQLVPSEALRLVATRWPAAAWFQSFKEETRHPDIRRKAEYIAVFRRGFGVRRLDLTRPAFELLDALARGRRLENAIAAVLRQRRVTKGQLFTWFRDWVSAGMFRAVVLADGTRVAASPSS